MQIDILPERPRRPEIWYYSDLSGRLRLIPNRPVSIYRNDEYILGMNINGYLRPIFNREEQPVLVRLQNNENQNMTPYLIAQYGHLFSRPSGVQGLPQQRVRPNLPEQHLHPRGPAQRQPSQSWSRSSEHPHNNRNSPA